MKNAFKILPGVDTNKNHHLFIEVGRDGISMVWYSKEPLKVEGLFVFQTSKNNTEITLAEEIQQLLASENLPHYNSCIISYNFKESLLVPDTYYKAENNTEMLNCVYGLMPACVYFSEAVKELAATNIYRVPLAVSEALHNRFYAAETSHSNSCQLVYAQQKNLYCIVYNNYIKTILFSEGNLKLIQLYDYNTPADVAYQLLNICTQHQLSPTEITLTLSGFIDKQSNLYEELYRYFLNIEMDELPQGIEVADEIKTHPAHFFSFLISMIKCAS